MSIRDEQKQFTRDRLLDAAFEVFGEVGFRNATIDQITDRAGANRTTFYLHFKDKADVAAGIGRRLVSSAVKELRRLDDFDRPTLREVRKWYGEYFLNSEKSPLASKMINEAINADPAFAEEYSAYLGRLADRVMVKTIGRYSGKDKAMVRAKWILLNLAWSQLSVLCAQGLKLPDSKLLDAFAEIYWREILSMAPSKSVTRAASLRPSPAAPVVAKKAARR